MELLYVYIQEYEEYRNFKNIEFNFSAKYKFEFKSSKLKCSEARKSNISYFWGKGITNLNVIVGDNGAGKTTLLRCIMDCISNGKSSTNAICFFVFLDKVKDCTNVKICTYGIQINDDDIEWNIKGLGKPEIFNDIVQNEPFMQQLKKNKIIYLHNSLEKNDYLSEKFGQVLDYSIGGLVRNDFKRNFENKYIDSNTNLLINYFNSEIYRQVDFIYSYNGEFSKKIIPFKLPEKLKITFVNNKNNLENILNDLRKYGDPYNENYTKEKQEFYKKLENLVYMIDNLRKNNFSWSNKEKWCALMAENIVANALKEIVISPIVPSNREKELKSFIDAYESLDSNGDILNVCSDFLCNVSINLEKNNSFYIDVLNPYVDFIKWIMLNYEKVNFDYSKIGLEMLYEPTFSAEISKNDKTVFEKFFEHYQKICTQFYFLNFSWVLSSGEYNLLSTYARLFSAVKTESDGMRKGKIENIFNGGEVECNNILLLIDEADLSYHPEWQSQYIYSLLKFLPSIYNDCDIQIILTTHSPIMLSDVPKGNVIYLRKEEKEPGSEHNTDNRENLFTLNDSGSNHNETFGQNIYTLFNDAFYFGNSKNKYIIGKFAENKIKRISDIMKNISENKTNKQILESNNLNFEEIKEIIELIGEPIIKFALTEELKKAKKIYNENESDELKVIMKSYDKLSVKDRNILIEYIIGKEE